MKMILQKYVQMVEHFFMISIYSALKDTDC